MMRPHRAMVILVGGMLLTPVFAQGTASSWASTEGTGCQVWDSIPVQGREG